MHGENQCLLVPKGGGPHLVLLPPANHARGPFPHSPTDGSGSKHHLPKSTGSEIPFIPSGLLLIFKKRPSLLQA